MSLIQTISEPIPAVITQNEPKTRRVPKRIAQLVDMLVRGEYKTQTAACERLKLDRSYACKQLKLPHVVAYIERQTHICLAQSQMPAAATMLRLLGAKSESVQKDVAIHLLGIAGHKPANTSQLSVSIDIKAGYVIDLTDGKNDGITKVIDHDDK